MLSTHLLVVLSLLLVLILLLASFFSAAETSVMSANRYRLRYLAKQGDNRAKTLLKLLDEPDRLLNMVIAGNTCLSIVASAIVSFIAAHCFGEVGVAIATGLLTLVVLLFCESLPKNVVALKPEAFALPAVGLLSFFIFIFSPLLWFLRLLVRGILSFFGVSTSVQQHQLSADELRAIISESSKKLPESHQNMLLQVLELERLSVADIMIPRQELFGIDIEDDAEGILNQLLNAPYRQVPVYRNGWNEVIGMVKIREVFPSLHDTGDWHKDMLLKHLMPVYVVPENVPLHKQLLNFKRLKRRSALVVDEFGDILGLVTLEDLLEEIVGEFTTDFADMHPSIVPQNDGSYLIDASINLRELNRFFKWHLPLSGPKTLSGYLIDYLQMIPESGTSVLLNQYSCEILQVTENRIKVVRLKNIDKNLGESI